MNSPEIGVGGPSPEPPCCGAFKLVTCCDITSNSCISSSLLHEEKIKINIKSL